MIDSRRILDINIKYGGVVNERFCYSSPRVVLISLWINTGQNLLY